eukprot:sb/3479457/
MFQLEYFRTQNLNDVAGGFVLGALQLSMGLSAFFLHRLKYSIRWKCVLYCSVASVVTLATCLVDLTDKTWAIFTILGLARFLQGIGLPGLYLLVQTPDKIHFRGEIVDLHFKDRPMEIGLISGSMHIGTIIAGTLIGAELYQLYSWIAVGLGMAGICLLPILFLPWLPKSQDETSVKVDVVMTNPVAELKESEKTEPSSEEKSRLQEKVVVETPIENVQKKLSTVQSLAFLLPDIVLFVNNLFFILLITAIPERMRLAGKTNTTYTVLMMNLVNVFSLLSSIGLSVTSSYITTVFWMMLGGNFLFYNGASLMYSSTTTFYSFPGSFELGTLIAGFGDASIVNMCITYKFELYRRWGVEMRSLGERSSIVYAFVMNISGILGSAISGVTVPESAGWQGAIVTLGTWVLMTVLLILPRLVNIIIVEFFPRPGEGRRPSPGCLLQKRHRGLEI